MLRVVCSLTTPYTLSYSVRWTTLEVHLRSSTSNSTILGGFSLQMINSLLSVSVVSYLIVGSFVWPIWTWSSAWAWAVTSVNVSNGRLELELRSSAVARSFGHSIARSFDRSFAWSLGPAGAHSHWQLGRLIARFGRSLDRSVAWSLDHTHDASTMAIVYRIIMGYRCKLADNDSILYKAGLLVWMLCCFDGW